MAHLHLGSKHIPGVWSGQRVHHEKIISITMRRTDISKCRGRWRRQRIEYFEHLMWQYTLRWEHTLLTIVDVIRGAGRR
jgi:hypothetical protein